MRQNEPTNSAAQTTRRAYAKAERRQSLIDATITSIATFGLSNTTMSRVTEIAETSIGLANFHFDSKERLLEAALQHLADKERSVWQKRNSDATLSPAERLIASVDARFSPSSCNPQTLAVWFAFWGDAGAREIYRRIVEKIDDERLDTTVAIIRELRPEVAGDRFDPVQTALGLEAFYDGLWLNLLLYPSDFKRLSCRQHAIDHITALFPLHFAKAQTAAISTAAGPLPSRT